MAAPAARSLASRVRHAIAFVAIVWGVAATFVAFDILALGGFNLASSFPNLFGEIALSPAVTQSTSCTARTAGTARAAPAGDGTSRCPRGRVGARRQAGSRRGLPPATRANPQSLEQTVADLGVLAGRLGVPAPPFSVMSRIANANTEFVAFVESDANETAPRLARGLFAADVRAVQARRVLGLLGSGSPLTAWRARRLRRRNPVSRARGRRCRSRSGVR